MLPGPTFSTWSGPREMVLTGEAILREQRGPHGAGNATAALADDRGRTESGH